MAEIRRRSDLRADEYLSFAGRIASVEAAPDLTLAYLGNVTLSTLPAFVNVACMQQGVLTDSYVGGFGQHMQEVLRTERLAEHDPDIVFLLLHLPALIPEELARIGGMKEVRRRELANDVLDHVLAWVESAKSRLRSSLLVSNFPPPVRPVLGVADTKEEFGETELYLHLNLELLRALRSDPQAHLFDLSAVVRGFGEHRARDDRMWFVGKLPWRDSFMAAVGERLARHVLALSYPARKCLVVDLDNTLWGGVVGEEGPGGIKVGQGDPESEAFLAAQREIRALKDRGVLLAACSKNNPEDVEEAFATRPGMPLEREDFSAWEVNWDPKHQNVRRIAETLNIGTDSLVFLDDNPAEVELIRHTMPEVETVLVPEDRSVYPSLLRGLPWFEKNMILDEDRSKSDQYRANRERTRLQAGADDLETYLESLETEVCVREANEGDVPRLHQLFTKTNQFNVTTMRYSSGDVRGFLENDDYTLVVAEAEDRFGDLGTIGLYLVQHGRDRWEIDSFLMSCRAMGRGIETAMMNHLKSRLLRHAKGNEVLTATYVPTRKNVPVERFFDEQGFCLKTEKECGRTYELSAVEIEMKPCGWLQLRDER